VTSCVTVTTAVVDVVVVVEEIDNVVVVTTLVNVRVIVEVKVDVIVLVASVTVLETVTEGVGMAKQEHAVEIRLAGRVARHEGVFDAPEDGVDDVVVLNVLNAGVAGQPNG
jgi:hypothetical protein